MATQGNIRCAHVRRSSESDGMNDLLKLAIEGHGGMPRWKQIARFAVVASITGAIWALRGMPGLPYRQTIETTAAYWSPGGMIPWCRWPGSPIRDPVSVAIDVAHVAFS
jgi:hypothetical protein